MNSFSIYLSITLCSVILALVQAKCETELDGTFLPDSRARNRFIYCWGGEEFPGQCDPGYEFDPFDRVCDYVGASSSDPCYNKPDDTFLPDPSSRFNFIFCSGGLSLVGTCENRMVFNPTEKVCEQDTVRTTQPPASNNPCRNKPDGTFLQDPSSRNAFFYCSGGEAFNGNCPDGENFMEEGALCIRDEVATTTRRPVVPVPTTRRPVATTTRRPVVTTTRRTVATTRRTVQTTRGAPPTRPTATRPRN